MAKIANGNGCDNEYSLFTLERCNGIVTLY